MLKVELSVTLRKLKWNQIHSKSSLMFANIQKIFNFQIKSFKKFFLCCCRRILQNQHINSPRKKFFSPNWNSLSLNVLQRRVSGRLKMNATVEECGLEIQICWHFLDFRFSFWEEKKLWSFLNFITKCNFRVFSPPQPKHFKITALAQARAFLEKHFKTIFENVFPSFLEKKRRNEANAQT